MDSGVVPAWKAKAILWKHGHLDWKLKAHQRRMHDLYAKATNRKAVFHCSRRVGKSYTLLTIAIEECLKRPGIRVPFAAPTQKNVKEIIVPTFREIIQDCPEHLRPEYRMQEGKIVFPNGSEIILAGTDGANADRLRGSAANLAILDEAGFMDNLRYVVFSILMPQLLTTDGRLILSSSSPVSPAHDFVHFIREAEVAGAYVKIPIQEDSRPEVIARIPEWMEETGGKDSTDWKREYECQLVTDLELSIIPEFDDSKAERIVRELPRPSHFDAYVAMDVGFNDLTAVLFGYWDFERAAVVIEDEVTLNRMTTTDLAVAISGKEASLWAEKKPFLRVSDTDLIVINDLSRLHGLNFTATRKDDKEAAINALRLMVSQEKLLIHPRCKNLIAHLKYGVWNKQKTQFERAAGMGHFDLIDALVYMVRMIRREKNPFPVQLGMSHATHFIPGSQPKTQGASRTLEGMFPGRAS